MRKIHPTIKNSIPVTAVGAVFTPLEWGIWASEKFFLVEKWLNGKTILDPTCGEGHLLEAVIISALKRGLTIAQLPLHRLFGIEREAAFLNHFAERMYARYGVHIPEGNIIHADLLLDPVTIRCDILLGNPPWCNFCDLPDDSKEVLKSHFIAHGLTGKTGRMLLGNSRVDIAALIMVKAIHDHLRENGEGVFFVPLSLLRGEGAHSEFRKFRIRDITFAVPTVYDFGQKDIFGGVSTRNGLMHIIRDQQQEFPALYFAYERNRWLRRFAAPVGESGDDWMIQRTEAQHANVPEINVSASCLPRQGINTGGANHVFIFKFCEPVDAETVRVLTSDNTWDELPAAFVFPLLRAENFKETIITPQLYVLLPYHANGIHLSETEMDQYPQLKNYLEKHREKLMNRKGVLLQSRMRKGCWWALMGVGTYNFARYKIVWEASGRNRFVPILITGRYQVNQSLQAYMSFDNKRDAMRVLRALKKKEVEKFLLAHGMPGSQNWAQPGRMKKLFKPEKTT